MATDGARSDKDIAGDCDVNPILRRAAPFDGEGRVVLMGRGQPRCPIMSRHTFGATYSSAEGTPVLIEPQQVRGFLNLRMPEDPRVYTLKTAAYDLIRVSVEPLLPFRLDQMQSIPAGATLGEKSQLKLAIDPYDFTDPRPIVIDFGQEIEILCSKLNVNVFGPPNLIYVPPDNDRLQFDAQASSMRSGQVLDSIISASVWATEEPRGKSWAYLTTNHVVAAATQPIIPVPNRAIGLTGYQSNLGAATGSWLMLSSVIVGSIPWAGRKTDGDEIILPNPSHIQPDVDPVNPRVFTLRWKIQL